MIYSHWIFSFLILLNAFNAFPSKIVNDHVQNPVESKSFEEFLSVLTDQLDDFVNETDTLVEIYNNLTNQSSNYLASHHSSSDSLSEKVTSLDKNAIIDPKISNYLIRVYRHLGSMAFISSLGALLSGLMVLFNLPSFLRIGVASLFPFFVGLIGSFYTSEKAFYSIVMSFFHGLIFFPIFFMFSYGTGASGFSSSTFFASALLVILYTILQPPDDIQIGKEISTVRRWTLGFYLVSFIFGLELSLGSLLISMFEVISALFIRFDTLKMMERAKSGSSDFIEDALKLYFDYFAVLGRLLLYHFEGKDESKNTQL